MSNEIKTSNVPFDVGDWIVLSSTGDTPVLCEVKEIDSSGLTVDVGPKTRWVPWHAVQHADRAHKPAGEAG